MTAPRTSGRLIVVNGTSSAGKSSLCAALQHLLDEPYWLLGYDRAWMMGPWRYGPVQANERDGVWYDLDPENPTVAVGIGVGPVGQRSVSGLHHMVASLLEQGHNVIVDALFMEAAWFEHAMRLWRPYRPLLVALKPPLEVSERWEAERDATKAGRPTGLARLAYDAVHAHGSFDVELDPSLGTPEDAARQVIERSRGRLGPAQLEAAGETR
ncbi:phosphotransferase-like protein [Deinococcus yavapaiensis]|uniref:Chloramphenicol 3-O phosphotransferase n=1 Tax=Deinococcus yavapaiensis KR-236 TaxID=694435 RepID=A0A318S9I6_9DEIO|nr:AAA family ATPase [Deinococcus yavapaiensis]PYE53752.1 chloramphenicol 3-O phosphotransferase [Deinococcus yavapaiensis KR-236]